MKGIKHSQFKESLVLSLLEDRAQSALRAFICDFCTH